MTGDGRDNDSGVDRGGQTETDTPFPLDDDELYRALAAEQRRRVLHFLLENPTSTVAELADVLAGWDSDEGGGMATPEDRQLKHVGLYHVHLPILNDAGLLAHDRSSGDVSVDDIPDSVQKIVRQSFETRPEPSDEES